MKRPPGSLLALGVAVVALIPDLTLSTYRLGILALVASYTIASLAQNLLAGYAGIPSLGNVAFFATSAYWTASLITQSGVPALPAMLLGVGAAGLVGFAIGLPAIRISGMHLAIVTVAIVFVAQELMAQRDQSQGQTGVTVSVPGWFLQERALYAVAVLLSAACYLAIWNMLRSRSGRAILAVTENPYAAQSVGVNPTAYRLLAFVISGVLTGAAGVIYLYYAHTVTPGGFPLDLSLAFLTMIIVGGSRSLGGSLLGALLIGLLPQFLALLPAEIARINVQESVSAIYAILLLVALRFFPDGIWSVVEGRWPALREEL